MSSASQQDFDAPARRSALALGSLALLMLGLQPILLGELVTRQLLSIEGVGLVAMGEILALGLGVALADSIFQVSQLRQIALLATLGVALLDGASCRLHSDLEFLLVRALAGIAEGLLVWVSTCIIVRSRQPDRMAAAFVVLQTLSQAALAGLIAWLILPRWGWPGGFLLLALCTLAGAALIPYLTRQLDLMRPATLAPLWLARNAIIPLVIACAIMAAIGAIWAYLEPLGLAKGLSPGAAQSMITLTLVAQVLGGLSAMASISRIAPRAGLTLGVGLLALLALALPWLERGALWPYALLCSVFGYIWLYMLPLQLAYALQRDPLGRSATLIPAAQLIGAALGPLAASLTVQHDDTHAVPYVSLAFALLALILLLGQQRQRKGHRIGRPMDK